MFNRSIPSLLLTGVLLASGPCIAQSPITFAPAQPSSGANRADRWRAIYYRPDGTDGTLAYKHVAIAAMLKEANYVGPKLGLAIQFPITEDDLMGVLGPSPTMQNLRNRELPYFGGAFRTSQYHISFSENGRLCFIVKFRPWGRMSVAERNDMLAAEKSLIDTNGAYQLATNWLAQIPVDVGRLERHGYANFGADEIKDAAAFTAKIQDGTNDLCVYLRGRLGEARGADGHYLADLLNPIVLGPSIYTESRFRGIALRPETDALVKKIIQSSAKGAQTRWNALDDLALCNRMLLEDAYPGCFSKLSGNPPLVEQEFRWARESTGEKDYLPLFRVSWGIPGRKNGSESPRIDIEIDGRKKELLQLRLEDDSVSQRPVGLFKNREELLAVPDQQFLGYSPKEQKAFIEKFLVGRE